MCQGIEYPTGLTNPTKADCVEVGPYARRCHTVRRPMPIMRVTLSCGRVYSIAMNGMSSVGITDERAHHVAVFVLEDGAVIHVPPGWGILGGKLLDVRARLRLRQTVKTRWEGGTHARVSSPSGAISHVCIPAYASWTNGRTRTHTACNRDVHLISNHRSQPLRAGCDMPTGRPDGKEENARSSARISNDQTSTGLSNS